MPLLCPDPAGACTKLGCFTLFEDKAMILYVKLTLFLLVLAGG